MDLAAFLSGLIYSGFVSWTWIIRNLIQQYGCCSTHSALSPFLMSLKENNLFRCATVIQQKCHPASRLNGLTLTISKPPVSSPNKTTMELRFHCIFVRHVVGFNSSCHIAWTLDQEAYLLCFVVMVSHETHIFSYPISLSRKKIAALRSIKRTSKPWMQCTVKNNDGLSLSFTSVWRTDLPKYPAQLLVSP